MPTVIVKQKVKDFETWKKAFDQGVTMRDQAGAKLWSVARDLNDPSTVLVVSDWPSLEHARKFLDNAKAIFAESGVETNEVRVWDSEIKL